MGCGSSSPNEASGPPDKVGVPNSPRNSGNVNINEHKDHPMHDSKAPVDQTDRNPSSGTSMATQKEKKEKMEEKKSWRDILTAVSTQDPWSGSKREERPKWKKVLEDVQQFLQTPRKKPSEDSILRVLFGDMSNRKDSMINKKTKVTIFVSSTFTDTQAERNLLIRDVYPYLRTMCRYLGLDFGTVDMRWGVKEEMTMEHGTTAMCLYEVARCNEESAGPSFLSILGHKYGYRTLPAEIEKAEFEKLVSLLKKQKPGSGPVEDFYQLDNNAVPAVYVLKPRKHDDDDWWNREKIVVGLFRTVAEKLGPDAAEKYFISITEQEVKSGFLTNPIHSEQVVSFTRELKGVRDETHLHRHMVDMKDGKVDEDAQAYLKNLKEKKIPSTISEKDVQLDFKYEKDEEEACQTNVMDVCDKVCEEIVGKILASYKENLHVEHDAVLDEVAQHHLFAFSKSKVFVGREDLLKRIQTSISKSNGSDKQVFVVHGRSGCGKTALMAVVAKNIKESLLPNAVLVLRFLGTTSGSGSARAVLNSVCLQIARVYRKDVSEVPTNYGDLIEYFQKALSYATESKPLVVVLDSLDQLSNEDFGQNLKWLSLRETIPPYAHVIVSTIPGGCFTTLQAYVPETNMVEIVNLSTKDGPLVVEKMLEAHNRTVTPKQKDILLSAFAKCPLPLYLRLAVDVALKWRSYDDTPTDAIATDMPGLINTLFQRLESKFGKVFVQHALAYITCAKDGLSVTELEDVLSCDDDVLDEIFDFWLPPFRRIPQLLWIRVRNELGMYLVERGTNGVNAYGWYHRQFWEAATTRYLNTGGDAWGEKKTRQILANYFDGIWGDGKLWTPKKKTRAVQDLTPRMEDRQVPHQPLVYSGSRTTKRQLNRRKLSELPFHIVKMKDWERVENTIATLEFIEAKFEAGQGYDCRSIFLDAAKETTSKKIKSFSKFVGLGLVQFLHEPAGVYQYASQQVEHTPVKMAFDEFKGELPIRIIQNMNPEDVEDPCDMTLRGHTNGIRCVRFHPSGNFFASASEDGSLRFWDLFSGAEIVAITGLPGPRYPALAGSYAGERPCVWDKEGNHIITGSEDGGIQVWDTKGAQVTAINPHSAAVTGVDVSNNSLFASASKDGTTKIWNLSDYSLKHTVGVGHCLDCAFSPDGSKLAVSIYGSAGLYIINCSDGSILSTGSGSCNLNICVDWSPRGTEIVTAGDNSALTVWNPNNGQITTLLRSHRAWIWCVHYIADGTRLLSCSSDRSVKLWDMDSRSCIATLGGHGHRVTGGSFRPGTTDTFVTSSYDMNLKVWDYEAVTAGRIPKVGGLHFIILATSMCGKYHATCQGWSKTCTFYDSKTNEELGTSSDHDGTVLAACFTPDTSLFVTVDTGHTGAWEEDVARRAHVKVCEAPHGGGEVDLDVHAPYAVASNTQCIAVGTVDGDVVLFNYPAFEKQRSWSISSVSPVDIHKMMCSETDNVIAVGAQKFVSVWDMSDGSLVAKLPPPTANVVNLPFSSLKGHLLVGLDSGEIQVYNAQNREYKYIKSLLGHTSKLTDLSFSLEGAQYLATASVDMSLRIWDVADDYTQHSVFYGPSTLLGFADKNIVIVGESTGNKNTVKFQI